jgi:hypothetical protein
MSLKNFKLNITFPDTSFATEPPRLKQDSSYAISTL